MGVEGGSGVYDLAICSSGCLIATLHIAFSGVGIRVVDEEGCRVKILLVELGEIGSIEWIVKGWNVLGSKEEDWWVWWVRYWVHAT